MSHGPHHDKTRGALSNPVSRFQSTHAQAIDDGWGTLETDAHNEPEQPPTRLHADPAQRVISRNRSPDVPFSASINPYKGCSHGCIYCFARPTHEYLDHSAGLDFETEIYYKTNTAERLEAELRAPGYRCTPITLGANTDPYQPDEKQLGITRELLTIAQRYRQPISIVTKSALVTRDLDILADMAKVNLASVMISVTSTDNAIKRTLEPRTAGPAQRFRTIAALRDAGVPVGVLIAPVIPMITDPELEALVERAAQAGAQTAGYILLRLPHGVKTLFREWLEAHYPQRAKHVMSLVAQMHDGRDYDASWGTRMTGTGVYARLLADRFNQACRRAGIDNRRRIALDCSQFAPPLATGPQSAFDFG